MKGCLFVLLTTLGLAEKTFTAVIDPAFFLLYFLELLYLTIFLLGGLCHGKVIGHHGYSVYTEDRRFFYFELLLYTICAAATEEQMPI